MKNKKLKGWRRLIYNNLIPRFLRHWRQKYFCGLSNWHKKPKRYKDFETYTCRICGACLKKKGQNLESK